MENIKIATCKILQLLSLPIPNLISQLFILGFVSNLSGTVYPYANFNSWFSNVIDLESLDFRLFFAPVLFLFSSLLIWSSIKLISFDKKWNNSFFWKYFFICFNFITRIIIIISIISILFGIYKYIELWHISLSVVNCDEYSGQYPGCYIEYVPFSD